MTLTPPYLEVEEGRLASFYCGVTGNPTPSRTWSRVGGAFGSEAVIDGGRLTFYRVTAEDAGDYECTAINSYGIDTEIATLTVTRGKTEQNWVMVSSV